MSDRERQFVRRAFGQYLAPSLVERLASDPTALSLGGETREMTVLFSDIRGFTSLSEGLDPQSLTSLLNNFLTPMTDVLLESGATIDKYIGDAIMAFWNAPLAMEDHRRRACLAALRMVAEVDALNEREGTAIRIGIGLNSGLCCVGNLGSEQRFSYSAIGDAVNVASRVEGLTKQYGLAILLSESTAAGAADLALLEVDLVRVVGRGTPLSILTLAGDEEFARTEEFARLATAHRSHDFTLPRPGFHRGCRCPARSKGYCRAGAASDLRDVRTADHAPEEQPPEARLGRRVHRQTRSRGATGSLKTCKGQVGRKLWTHLRGPSSRCILAQSRRRHSLDLRPELRLRVQEFGEVAPGQPQQRAIRDRATSACRGRPVISASSPNTSPRPSRTTACPGIDLDRPGCDKEAGVAALAFPDDLLTRQRRHWRQEAHDGG